MYPRLNITARQESSPVFLAEPLSHWSRKRGWTRQPVMATSCGKWMNSTPFTGPHHNVLPLFLPCPLWLYRHYFPFSQSHHQFSEGLSRSWMSSLPSSLALIQPLEKSSVILLPPLCRWEMGDSERKLIDFSHTIVEPAFETTSARLQSHRGWNSFIHKYGKNTYHRQVLCETRNKWWIRPSPHAAYRKFTQQILSELPLCAWAIVVYKLLANADRFTSN